MSLTSPSVDSTQSTAKPGATTPWVYRPPRTAQGYANQRYYRALTLHANRGALETVDLLRFAGSEEAKLTLRVEADYGDASLTAALPRAALLQLRDALNDALHEMQEEDEEREREESFRRISDEMRDAEEMGGAPGCYYCHPDIHYVAPSEVEAKVAALEAAGCKRYMVLRDPAATEQVAA